MNERDHISFGEHEAEPSSDLVPTRGIAGLEVLMTSDGFGETAKFCTFARVMVLWIALFIQFSILNYVLFLQTSVPRHMYR